MNLCAGNWLIFQKKEIRRKKPIKWMPIDVFHYQHKKIQFKIIKKKLLYHRTKSLKKNDIFNLVS